MNDIGKDTEVKGPIAPRITLVDIGANISCEYCFTAEAATEGCPQHDSLKLLTFCVLVLKNGFTVTGESVCVSPEDFDFEIEREIARAKAEDKIWPLMSYELKSKIAEFGGES